MDDDLTTANDLPPSSRRNAGYGGSGRLKRKQERAAPPQPSPRTRVMRSTPYRVRTADRPAEVEVESAAGIVIPRGARLGDPAGAVFTPDELAGRLAMLAERAAKKLPLAAA